MEVVKDIDDQSNENIGDLNGKTIHPSLSLISDDYYSFQIPYPCTTSKKTISSWAQTWIEAVQFESLTNMLLKWYLEDIIGIHWLSIENIFFNETSLVESSSHSTKAYGREMQVGRIVIPNQARK